ncbi:hypothetical protein GCK32_022346, partial [Trichostrongylus colubriformis]
EDKPFKTAGAGERTLLLMRLRHSASSVKEILLPFGTRYIPTDRIYERRARFGGNLSRYERWLAGEGGTRKIGPVNMMIDEELRQLVATINRMEELLTTAEKDLKRDEGALASLRRSKSDQSSENEDTIATLKRLLREQADNNRSLELRLSSLEQPSTSGAQEQRASLLIIVPYVLLQVPKGGARTSTDGNE